MGPSIIDVWLDYYPMFFRGLLGTLKYAAIAVSLGTVIGSVLALMRVTHSKVLNVISSLYTLVIRGTPLLVQMYIAYFFIPMAIPAMDFLSKEQCVILALVLNSAAYVAEIIRSGINAVDSGQMEAARSLGMTYWHAMSKIIMPQAVKNILPALANEYIAMIKETSLAGTFMLYELMYTRTLLANKFLTWQPLFIIAGMYLLCTTVLSYFVRLFEKRLSVSD